MLNFGFWAQAFLFHATDSCQFLLMKGDEINPVPDFLESFCQTGTTVNTPIYRHQKNWHVDRGPLKEEEEESQSGNWTNAIHLTASSPYR